MSNRDFLFWFADELGKFVHPLEIALTDEKSFTVFLKRYGWLLEPGEFEINDVQNAIEIINNLTEVASVSREILTPRESNLPVESYINLVTVFKTVSEKLRGLSKINAPNGFTEEMWGAFSKELLNGLISEYLEEYHPILFATLILMVVIEEEFVDVDNALDRTSYIRRSIHWDRLLKGITKPSELFQEVYGWNHPTKPFDFEFLQSRLVSFFGFLGIPTSLDPPNQELLNLYFGQSNPDLPHVKDLSIMLMDGADENQNSFSYSLKVLPIPPKEQALSPPSGLVIRPSITTNGEFPSQLIWPLSLEFSGFFQSKDNVRLEIQPNQITTILDVLDETDIDANLAVSFESNSPMILLGTLYSHHLQMYGWKIGLKVAGPVDDLEFIFELSFDRCQIVIDSSETDNFIRELSGSGMNKIDFDTTIIWSSKTGIHFDGQVSLGLRIPIDRTFSIFHIASVNVGINTKDENIEFTTGVSGTAALGPILVSVDNVGVRLLLEQVGEGQSAGVLGDLDIDFDFKAPDGIGLTIDGGGFKGGGFLGFEEDEQRYVGFLELEFKDKIGLKAIGLLTTQLPDGSDGYSLLIIITAEFTPIQLGFGFTLNGVGGLLGLNRTANVERLRSGVKDNTLSSVLFPQDIVANASRIISDLRQVFPPKKDRFIFGPMLKIGWGSPTLITADLGLMIEIPNPVRLYLLGVARVQLPSEEQRVQQEQDSGSPVPILLQLQVNFLGVVDFDAKKLSIDASLYNSKLLTFVLSGDMAVRFSWGDEPNFLMSIGGFHPTYEPPPLALPNLQRLTLSLLSGTNPRLTMESYYAVTSNTIQFGARVDLYAVKSKFNVTGFLSYDVLFQLNPFYFIADIGAMLALKIGSRDIASIHLALSLDGPTPWHAKGTAKLKICWFFTLKVRFNKTFGEERDTRLDDVAVLPLLQAALSNKGNWESQLPNGGKALVSVKEVKVSDSDIVVDPAGVLSISQKVVPLKTTIEKFGSQLPSDAHRFVIEKVQVGEGAEAEFFDTTATKESFAPAQFFEKTDAQKLTSKSFERLESGVKLVQSEKMRANYRVLRRVEYELSYSDEQRNQRIHRRPGLFIPDRPAFNALSSQGAVAASPLSYDNKPKPVTAPDAVRVLGERFAVVNVSNMQAVNAESFVENETGAYQLMDEILSNNPALEGELQVVPDYEMDGVIGL